MPLAGGLRITATFQALPGAPYQAELDSWRAAIAKDNPGFDKIGGCSAMPDTWRWQLAGHWRSQPRPGQGCCANLPGKPGKLRGRPFVSNSLLRASLPAAPFSTLDERRADGAEPHQHEDGAAVRGDHM